MFEAAELGRKVSKQDYETQVEALRPELLDAQFALRETNIPVIVIVAGVDGAGKGQVVNRLNEWLDPRDVEVTAFGPHSDEEQERPAYWRYWRALPPRGRIGVVFGSWYTGPIVRRVYREVKDADLDRALDRIVSFERMLVQDGALLVKFWFHLSKEAQRKRLRCLEKDPDTRWQVSPIEWKHFKRYSRFAAISERAIRHTDTGLAPWVLVEATDPRYRDLMAGRTLLQALKQRLETQGTAGAVVPSPLPSPPPGPEAAVTILDHVDISRRLDRDQYRRQLLHCQGKLSRLSRRAWTKGRSTVVVFEGWDAAGKGGAIRRMTAAIDARGYRVISIAAPTDEERAHHYLWRFWRHIPRAGHVTIYDRSWYGRVLVERVEGFASEPEWMRAHMEINDFEEQLCDHGIALVKFWLHISNEEQLRRFQEREQTPYKQYKITAEDWRNREKWDAYKDAVNDMVARTSTSYAPWTLVPANDKKYARIHILSTVCERLEAML